MSKYRLAARERNLIYRKHNGHCAYCGQKIPYERMRLSWQIPGKDGGTFTIFNLQPACISCCKYKTNKSDEEFRQFIDNTSGRMYKEVELYRLCVHFGVIEEKDTETKFYFEMSKKEKEEFHE